MHGQARSELYKGPKREYLSLLDDHTNDLQESALLLLRKRGG